MALVESSMMELGSPMPTFELTDVKSGEAVSIHEGNKGYLVIFMCNHCPYVIHVLEKLVEIANVAQQEGVQVVAINSNDAQKYPADSPEKMIELIEKYLIEFPYCFDEDQSVAKAYNAACTPDFFLFDENEKLVYRGRMDASTPGNGAPVTGEELSKAIAELIEEKTVSLVQRPSMGCNIKWK